MFSFRRKSSTDLFEDGRLDELESSFLDVKKDLSKFAANMAIVPVGTILALHELVYLMQYLNVYVVLTQPIRTYLMVIKLVSFLALSLKFDIYLLLFTVISLCMSKNFPKNC